MDREIIYFLEEVQKLKETDKLIIEKAEEISKEYDDLTDSNIAYNEFIRGSKWALDNLFPKKEDILDDIKKTYGGLD